MRIFFKTALPLMVIWLLLKPCLSQAQSKAVTIETTGGNTVVTMLEGHAFLIKEDLTRIRSLALGDDLKKNDRVQTGRKSRIELKLPDESYIRLDEMTIFVLKLAAFDQAQKQRDIDVTMILGKIWAKVAKFLNRKDRFAVSAYTAVAGVRGTTYRMNVNPDKSVMVKVMAERSRSVEKNRKQLPGSFPDRGSPL